MENFDDFEVIRGSELRDHPDQAALKFLRGGYSRLVQTTALLTEKSDSMEVVLKELQKSMAQISNQLGQRSIAAESSHPPPPVTFSDSYVRDNVNRLPLDNRKSLLRKIEMPKFDGSNAYDWLSKVERFFRVGRYSDLDKLDLVAFSLEGDVLKWFNWEMTRKEFHSWDEFRRRLFRRFGAAPAEAPTISAYVTEFEEFSTQVIDLEVSQLEQIFNEGFKPINQTETISAAPEESPDNRLFAIEQTEMKEVLKLKEPRGLEDNKPAVLRMETGSFCQLFREETSKPWGNQQTSTSKHVASVHSLSFAVGTEETIFSGLSQTSQVWEPGGVLDAHVLVDSIVAAPFAEKYAEESEESLDGTEDVVPVAARGPEVSNELLFGPMYNTLHLLEMGFSKHEISMAIDKIGTEGQISPTLSEDCTHVLLEPRKQVKEALVNASLAKKPIILTNWVKLIAEKITCSEIPGYYKPSVRGEDALLDVVTTPVTDDAIFQLVLAQTVSHEWHRWKHKTASVTSNDRVIAADIGRQAVLEQIMKGVRHALLHNQLFALGADNIHTLPRKPATSSSMLPLYVNQMGASDFQDNDKDMVADLVTQAVLHPVTTAARFGLVSVLSCVLWLLGTLFWSTSFKKQKFGKNWWYKFKHSLWQRECGRELLEVEVLVAETVVAIRYDDVGRRELLVKWLNLDSPATSWMFSTDFVRLCPTFKLEDKLRFEGGSIDTIQGLVMTWQEAQIQVKTRMGIEGLPFQAIVVREAP